MADGASNNVVALLQGKSVPPNDEEIFEGAKSRCERVEKELQRAMENHDSVQDDLEVLLEFLMDVKENHPSAMYSSGIDPERCVDVDSLMNQVRLMWLVMLISFFDAAISDFATSHSGANCRRGGTKINRGGRSETN